MDRSVLDKDCREISAALVERGLDYGTYTKSLRVCLQVHEVSFQKHFLQKLVHVETLLCGNFLALVFSTPVLHKDIHLSQLLTDFLRLCARLVYLVDGEYHRDSGSLRMVDGLHCLRHHGVVSRNDDDRKVGKLCTTGTHRCKCLMTRSIEEGNLPSVVEYHVVCTDVLCDTSGLTGDHIGLSDIVEERSLAMVDVSHHRDDRRPCHEVSLVLRLIGLLVDFVLDVGGDELHLVSELLCHEYKCLRVKPLVD